MSRRPLLPATLALGLGLLAGLAPVPAEAIPAFARKYGFNCTMCHSNFPRLNDFGHRYRRNGYRVPGKEAEERTVLESPPPIAARAAAAFNVERSRAMPEDLDATGFRVGYFDVLSGGLLGRSLGYFLVYPPPIPDARGLTAQPGVLEMANVIAAQPLGTTWLNVRAGRFEPAYVAFSVKRQLSASPREVYDLAFPGGAPLSETQEGIEVSGWGAGGRTEYYAGWIQGSATNRARDVPADLYLRLTQDLGQGEGQTAGQRFGVTAWYGSARPEGNPAAARRGYVRVGADASLNVPHFNLALQALWLNDARELWGMADAVNTYAGFAELSWMPRHELVAFARACGVLLPDEIAGADVVRGTAGVRYYPVDNLALHLEYSHATRQFLVPGPERGKEDLATARVDWAF